MTTRVMAAVDLGASGGRVIAARVSGSGAELHEVSRFPNEPVLAGGTLYWDILRLYGAALAGLSAAAAQFPLAGVGIDSWGVDYGLLDAGGALIGKPVHYRDSRTDGVTSPVPAAELYAVTGIQHLPFNTIYQLAAAAGTPELAAARTLLLIPDLLGFWLTGSVGAEVTNASTTALLDVSTREWAADLMKRAGIPPGLFPPLRQPGDLIGPVRVLPGPVPLIAVGSHDTASAVAAVPADGPNFAYISSGTWSLVGMELSAPVLTQASRLANFTNEAGIDGTIRYLRNVTGLWLLQECQREWAARLGSLSLDSLFAQAARIPPLRFVVDADDPVFLSPGGMPDRIVSWLSSRGLPAPSGPGRDHPVRPGQPGARVPARPDGRAAAVRPARRHRARRGRRVAQRTAVPAHRRRLWAAGRGRAGRGHRTGQRASAGPRARRRARRAGRYARDAARQPRTSPLRAVGVRARVAGRGGQAGVLISGLTRSKRTPLTVCQ